MICSLVENRSKADVEAQGAVEAITPAAWPRTAPTHEIERQGRWKQGGGMVGRYTRGESAGSTLRYL